MVFEWEWGEGSRGEVAVGEEGGRRKGKGGVEVENERRSGAAADQFS